MKLGEKNEIGRKIIEELQKNTEGLVIMKNGSFYISIKEDALILEQELMLKKTCFGKNCKVGMPANHIEKYIDKIKSFDISFNLCSYEKGELELIEGFRGSKNRSDFDISLLTCEECKQKKEDVQEKIFSDIKKVLV